jgi:hypothetical protein
VGVGGATIAAAITQNAVSDITEVFTGYNPVRDSVFKGNQDAYDTYKTASYFFANGFCTLGAIAQQMYGSRGSATDDCAKNPLENTHYTEKVKGQMQSGDHHGFPDIVDNYGGYGTTRSVPGGDGVTRTWIEIPGAYDGKSGIFQYIIEPDGTTVNHRDFIPNK